MIEVISSTTSDHGGTTREWRLVRNNTAYSIQMRTDAVFEENKWLSVYHGGNLDCLCGLWEKILARSTDEYGARQRVLAALLSASLPMLEMERSNIADGLVCYFAEDEEDASNSAYILQDAHGLWAVLELGGTPHYVAAGPYGNWIPAFKEAVAEERNFSEHEGDIAFCNRVLAMFP